MRAGLRWLGLEDFLLKDMVRTPLGSPSQSREKARWETQAHLAKVDAEVMESC